MNLSDAKQLLVQSSPQFWPALAALTGQVTAFDELIFLSSLRKKAVARGLARPNSPGAPVRLAILGGCSLYPLHELLAHLLETAATPCELFLGEYDNYVAEIMEKSGPLYRFQPQVVLLLPHSQRCKHPGKLTDSNEVARAAADAIARQLLDLCGQVHENSGAEVVLVNFLLPARHDPGELRTRTLTSDWNFRKWVNLTLGLESPAFVRLCDLEFLGNRHGALAAEDWRGWFESKQPCSPALLVEISREVTRLILALREPAKKVLALDLDNTLWGGVVADDGLEGIEIGDTSPRGEAFKAFQKYLLSLKERGVLLAICSKNDHNRAAEAFEKHPEMILRLGDFVAFKADWEPKSDNLRRMAAELKLGLESFVFADDNPAEIEIVRQFAPAVTTLLLGPDPADYVTQLQDARLFETRRITGEDMLRTSQYRSERERETLLTGAADMDSYLTSLAMEAVIREFTPVDVPRLTQLINKSNQFNLTTRRRTESEVQALMARPDYICFSLRLKDRFGDHGLVSIVIGHQRGETLEVDTWLMSCRVLKRQVEETVLNELVRLAAARGCLQLEGLYLATARNEMVRDFYPGMGFQSHSVTKEKGEFTLVLDSYQPKITRIALRRRAYESD